MSKCDDFQWWKRCWFTKYLLMKNVLILFLLGCCAKVAAWALCGLLLLINFLSLIFLSLFLVTINILSSFPWTSLQLSIMVNRILISIAKIYINRLQCTKKNYMSWRIGSVSLWRKIWSWRSCVCFWIKRGGASQVIGTKVMAAVTEPLQAKKMGLSPWIWAKPTIISIHHLHRCHTYLLHLLLLLLSVVQHQVDYNIFCFCFDFCFLYIIFSIFALFCVYAVFLHSILHSVIVQHWDDHLCLMIYTSSLTIQGFMNVVLWFDFNFSL